MKNLYLLLLFNLVVIIGFSQPENYNKAVEEFNKLLYLKNDSLIVHCENKIIEYAPKSEFALYVFAWKYFDDENDSMAFKLASDLTKDYPSFAAGHYALGSFENNINGNYEKAIGHFNKAVEIDPKFSFAYRNTGIALFNLEKYPEADIQFQKSMDLYTEDTICLQFYGMNLYMLGDYEKANGILSTIRDEDVLIPDFYYYYGYSLESMELYADALIAFSKGIMMDPEDPEMLFGHGWMNYQLGNDKDALYDFSVSTVLDSAFTDGYFGAGMVYSQMGKYKEALNEFNILLSIDSLYPDGNFYRGAVLYELKYFEYALDDFNKAICLDPEDSYGYYYRCLTNMADGEIMEDDLNDFQTAIDKGNADPEIYLSIATIALDFVPGLSEKAISKALEIDSEYADAIYFKGKHIEKDPDKACEFFKKAEMLGNRDAGKAFKKNCKSNL